MMKYIKPAVIILLLFCFREVTFCQKQTSVTDYITGKFLKYCKEVPWEEIFVHTDREEYIAGEDLWFNIYLIDRQNSRLSENSKIAYFELLNQVNQPVVQKRIRIDNGSGPGQVIIPDTLSPGTYILRTYTNWMKNFLPDNCFQKEINIYNAISHKAFKKRVSNSESLRKAPLEEDPKETTSGGFSMRIDNKRADSLVIILFADRSFRAVNSDICYMFIQTQGVINRASPVRITGEVTKVSLPGDILPPGINHVTIFDLMRKPVAERFVYTPDREDHLLSVRLPDSCNTRSKVIIELDLNQELVSSLNENNLSLSVAPKTGNVALMDIKQYLIMGSEFGIVPLKEISGLKISEIPADTLDRYLLNLRSRWIDWKAILSDNLPSFQYKIEKENHYIAGKLIDLNLNNADSGTFLFLSIPDKEAVFQYARTDEEGNYSFSVPIDDELKDLIIQPLEISKNFSVKIESSFSEKYAGYNSFTSIADLEMPDYISKQSVNYQVNRIYESSSRTIAAPVTILSPKPKRFYGKPDIELVMDDYIKLPVMSEVFFELLPGVFLKTRRSVYEITIADPVTSIEYDKPPVLFVDGVIIDNPAIIAEIDPETVERIDVVKERYIVGDFIFYGLVNVITRAGDYSFVSLPDYAVRFPYRVTEPVYSFISPDYSTPEKKQSRIPDFRNTLYWNPSLKPDKEGKVRVEFWTSDYKSDIEINIQGISGDGKVISFKKIIKVE